MATNDIVRSQRAWARIAGLMYWAVLVVDLTGMQLRSPAGSRSLMLVGSLLTVPLALGLYFTVRPVQYTLAVSALGFRLTEAVLSLISTMAGFADVKAALSHYVSGGALLEIARWDCSRPLSQWRPVLRTCYDPHSPP